MYTLVILSVIVAAAVAKPAGLVSVAQDTLGSYDLKYVADGISRAEHRDVLGNVAGGFAYVDPHGIVRKTEFTSGVHGYNAFGPDIPIPVIDTPEVAHAKAEHLAVLRAEYSRPLIPDFQDAGLHRLAVADVPLVRSHIVPTLPVVRQLDSLVHFGGVHDTPEVIAARAEHLAAHAAARSGHLLGF